MGPLLLLKVSVLLSVTLMAARLLYRAPAASRHALWSLSFAALLLLPPLAAALPAFYVPIPTGWDTTPLRIAPAIEQHSAVASPDQPTRPTGTPDIADAQDIQHVSASAADRAADWPAVNTLFFAGWLIGVAAAAVAVFVSLFKVHRLTRTAEVVQDPAWHRAAASVSAALGVHVPVRLLLSGRVSTPMVGGFRNPSIFLPPSASSWSLEHRILVLAHEIAHVAAHDPLRHLITRVALACYWFHPLAWIAAREAAIAREQACDETVLALGARPSAYARVLLDLAESMSARPPVRFLGALPMVHRSNLETRLMAILNVGVRPTTRRLIVGLASGVALLTLAVAAAQPHATTVSAAEVARFTEERAVPFVETSARPFAAPSATPPAETPVTPVPQNIAAAFAGVPLAAEAAATVPAGPVDQAQSGQGRESACVSAPGSGSDRSIQRSFGDLRLCMLAEGVGDRNTAERPSEWIGRALRIVMEAHRRYSSQRLEIIGSRTSWHVDVSTREFNTAAQTWRDHMLAVLNTTWEVSSLHGEVSGLRGQISALQGQRGALESEIFALQDEVRATQGRLATVQSEDNRLRREMSSIHAHVSALQEKISAERSAISRLRMSPSRVFSAINLERLAVDSSIEQRERTRIATEIADHEFAIVRIQRQIRDYGAEGRLAAVQKESDALDAVETIASIEREIRNFDVEGKVAAARGRIAALDVDGRVAGIQRQLDTLDADRRVRQLEDRLNAELARLTSAISAIR